MATEVEVQDTEPRGAKTDGHSRRVEVIMKNKARPQRLTRGRLILLSVFTFLALSPFSAAARRMLQQGAPSSGRPTFPDAAGPGIDAPVGPSGLKLEHMREDDRRKRLLSDTAKLVALSNELRSEVEKTPKDELSLDVVKKAAEIEKLARDVKERMKG